jgi:phage N-6-adenine-methyltransferase
MNIEVMFSSATVNWSTPQSFFDQYNQKYQFDLDVCALPDNTKCPVYFTTEVDGLKQPREGVVWMNPPYGREISNWIEKTFQEANRTKSTVVSLLPARTDTRWFQNNIYNKCGVEVEFVKGRLKFGDAKNSAPFPSMVVVFKPCDDQSIHYCRSGSVN